MTTLAAVPSASTRAVSWGRLGWVAWRHYRLALVATVSVLGLVAVYYVVSGLQIHTAYDAWRSCTPRNSASCTFQLNNFQNKYGSTGLLGFVQVLAPGVVGAFIGAPLLARELESGTYRYAWTQGVGRVRWTLALLAPGIIGSALLMTAFGELVAWRNRPVVAAGVAQPMDGSLFPAVAPAVTGWALLAFAMGVLAGLVWRRVVAAVVTTILLWFGVAAAVSLGLREHYLTPLTTTKLQLDSADLTIAQWWTKDGHRVGVGELNQFLHSAGVGQLPSGNSSAQASPGSGVVDPIHYLARHGYTQVTSYQPAGRYQAFQWIEFGWLTVITALLLAVAVLLLRRRQA